MYYRRFKCIAFSLAVCVCLAPLAHAGPAAKQQGLPSFLTPGASIITGGLADRDKKPEKANEETTPAEPSPAPRPQAPPDPPVDATALAPVKAIADIVDDLKQLAETIDTLETALADQKRDDSFLSRARPKIEDAVKKAEQSKELLQPRLSDIESQIEKLGPVPKDGAATETDQIREERAKLAAAQSEIAGAKKTAELLIERARQLAGQTQNLRQRLFADAILAKRRSPLAPSLWSDVVRELPAGGRQLASLAGQWGAVIKSNWVLALALVAMALVAFELLRRLMRQTRAQGLARAQDQEPGTFFQRAVAATWVTASYVLPGLAAACFLYIAFDSVGLLPIEVSRLAQVMLLAFVIILAVWALSRAILQPRRPAWRLFEVPNAAAERLTMIFTAMAGVYGTDLVLQQLMQSIFLPLPVRVIEAAIVTFSSAALLFAFVRTPLSVPQATPSTTAPQMSGVSSEPALFQAVPSVHMVPRWLKWPALGLSLAMTIAALAGYVALGRFMAGQVIIAGCLIVLGLLLWFGIRTLTRQTGELSERPLEFTLRKHMRLEESQARLLTKTTSILLQGALPFAAVPVLFLSWGYSLGDAIAWLKSLFFGFQIGQFRISLVQIVLAAGIFVAVLFITRMIQRWLTARVMQPGRLDHGVAHSVHTGVGYLGFVVAALLAVSYAGFDITNLAIVAGALSIGIGFGLQSIVNNFVSGLIILFERPIKVGDWVSVNNYEGYIRKISVRSTEIETFDRTNVIVPNSEFISNPIVNLTHRNALGRVVIRVGVSYSSDPEYVRNLLMDVANECPVILDNPSPNVAFEDFGASSLDFSVRAYIADVNGRLNAATQLRMQIFKALAEANVEIPFPQHDIHLRDLDPVRSALQRVALEKTMRGAGGSDGTPSKSG